MTGLFDVPSTQLSSKQVTTGHHENMAKRIQDIFVRNCTDFQI